MLKNNIIFILHLYIHIYEQYNNKRCWLTPPGGIVDWLIFIILFFNLLFLFFKHLIARNKAHQEIYIDINANKLNNVRLIGLKTKKTNDIIYTNFKFCKKKT